MVSVRPKYSKVSERGLVVIPVKLRRAFGIRKGTRVIVFEEDRRIVIQPLTPEYLLRVRGSLKGQPDLLKSLLKERKRDREL